MAGKIATSAKRNTLLGFTGEFIPTDLNYNVFQLSPFVFPSTGVINVLHNVRLLPIDSIEKCQKCSLISLTHRNVTSRLTLSSIFSIMLDLVAKRADCKKTTKEETAIWSVI